MSQKSAAAGPTRQGVRREVPTTHDTKHAVVIRGYVPQTVLGSTIVTAVLQYESSAAKQQATQLWNLPARDFGKQGMRIGAGRNALTQKRSPGGTSHLIEPFFNNHIVAFLNTTHITETHITEYTRVLEQFYQAHLLQGCQGGKLLQLKLGPSRRAPQCQLLEPCQLCNCPHCCCCQP